MVTWKEKENETDFKETDLEQGIEVITQSMNGDGLCEMKNNNKEGYNNFISIRYLS